MIIGYNYCIQDSEFEVNYTPYCTPLKSLQDRDESDITSKPKRPRLEFSNVTS